MLANRPSQPQVNVVITYSQNFEDVMLARVFGDRKEGFYVDVGAGDPKRLSVTKWFYDQGWSGINIEPNRDLFQALSAARPRDVNLDCGIGERAGVAAFSEMSVGELSSFDSAVQASAVASGCESSTRMVEIRTLDDVLSEHAKGRTIDFLKIDVEGWERQVLEGLDLGRFRPIVMVIEATAPGTRIESRQGWEDMLTRAGYGCVWFDGLNRFYLANEHEELRTTFSMPPNVFDHFEYWQIGETRRQLAGTKVRFERIQGVFERIQGILDQHTGRLVAATSAAGAANGTSRGQDDTGLIAAVGAATYAASILASRRKTARHFLRLITRRK